MSRALRAALGPHLARVTQLSEARLLDAAAAPLRWFGALFGAEGWAMLLVAVVGTFAVMWLWVASLLRELGVRRAIGARRRDVLRFVLARARRSRAGRRGVRHLGGIDGVGRPAGRGRRTAGLGSARRGGLRHAAGGRDAAGALLPAWRAARAAPARLLAAP